MGRWAANSGAFLEYIREQLSTFSAGMADKMAAIGRFTNVEGHRVAEDLRGLTLH